MNAEYNYKAIEEQARQYWEQHHSFENDGNESGDNKFYCVSMFPYPSGKIHMGHVRNYVITDIFARYHRQLGDSVVQPFGWDAFGLPAENAALQRGVAPAAWTYRNIEQMRDALCTLGLSIDWRREIATCKPEYYRYEQELFLYMYRHGLAYRKEAMVNWDPVDQTVLANEQVIDGRGWRSGALVERKKINQWFLKITAYADELLQELDNLPDWPEEVKVMQRNWIGRSEGAEVFFRIEDLDSDLKIYSTRLDTIYGVSYLAIAVDHPLALQAASLRPEVADFIERFRNLKVAERDLATLPKEGIQTPWVAIHPLTGRKVPIWIANFVLMEYGNGAVMAVPAHDQRDFAFAKQYQLPILPVIKRHDGENGTPDYQLTAWTQPGVLFNSGEFDGLSSEQAKKAILQRLVAINAGNSKVNYRLRDWGISRQRYWGAPIPIIYCPHCGVVEVSVEDLPVVLPEDVSLNDPRSPLTSMPEFYQVKCPKCHAPARRETDTFDTFMESSWYFLRYCSYDCISEMLDERAGSWMPVDLYVGGIEHAILHLLYARFIHKVIRDRGYPIGNEPFKRLLTQGMVLKDGSKMSKSKGNIVEPGEMIQRYGADTVRLFMTFAAPPEQALEWSQSGVEGAYRFLKRLYALIFNNLKRLKSVVLSGRQHWMLEQKTAWAGWQQLLAQVTRDMNDGHLNTVVSGSMKMLNCLSDWQSSEQTELLQYGIRDLLRVLYPVTPHLAHYLWQELSYGEDIVDAGWPEVDHQIIGDAQITIVVQINGKLKDKIQTAAGLSKEQVSQVVMDLPSVRRVLGERCPEQVVWIPDRLINLVVKKI